MNTTAFPLTLPQSGIYLDQARNPASPCYNVGGYIRLDRVDEARLAAAHASLVQSHEAFGLRIACARDELRQRVVAQRSEALPVIDLSAHADADADADAWIARQFETPFEVDERELFRAWLLKLAPDRYRYVGLAHHLLMDGWGFANWARELAGRYAGNAAPASSCWADVAADDADYFDGPRYAADRAFWRERLQQRPARLFGTVRPDAPVRSERLRIALDESAVARIEDCARQLDAGAAHVLLAALAVCLGIGAEHDEMMVGLPFHNRRTFQRKRMLGVFANMTPLRMAVRERDCTFAQLVQQIGREQKACLRHQRYPAAHIARDLGSSESLFDVAFNYLALDAELRFDEAAAGLVYVSHRHESRPLMVTYWSAAGDGRAELQFDYSLAHFDDAEARRFAARLCHLIDSLPALPPQRVSEIDRMPAAERQLLLQGFGEADLPVDAALCIHTLFERQAELTPDAVAVSDRQRQLSYAALNAMANRLARRLVASGVVAESLVGICLNRSVDLLVAVLAVLKAGGAYVPLDPAYPPARIRALVEDADLRLALSEDALSPLLHEAGVATLSPLGSEAESGDVDNAANLSLPSLHGGSRAYVIYTSGSSGKPKGVEICHGNAVALLAWAQQTYVPDDLARVLASTSLNFDLSVFELFAPLCVGGEVAIVRDALELLERRIDVSLVNTVPSAMRVLIDQGAVPRSTRVVNLAGEPLPQRTVNDLLGQRLCERVYNLYGPSEDTTYSTCARFDRVVDTPPSIGRAIANTRAYVLDAQGRLAPFGARGELHLSGDGVARGYLGSPELTARKFVRNPFVPGRGTRLYKTGDLVRYRSDGELDYLGRLDEQVKIRGFRIELGEIRQALERQPGVVAACVLTQESAATGACLVAFVECTAAEDAPPPATTAIALRRALQAQLPAYLVPAAVVVLDRLPLTANGKVDKARLHALETRVDAQDIVAPAGDTELRLAALWAAVLGIAPGAVGATASLFDLGGHSLLLVRLANEIAANFGVELSVRDLFAVADLRGLARRIDTEIEAASARRYVEEQLRGVAVLSEGTL